MFFLITDSLINLTTAGYDVSKTTPSEVPSFIVTAAQHLQGVNFGKNLITPAGDIKIDFKNLPKPYHLGEFEELNKKFFQKVRNACGPDLYGEFKRGFLIIEDCSKGVADGLFRQTFLVQPPYNSTTSSNFYFRWILDRTEFEVINTPSFGKSKIFTPTKSFLGWHSDPISDIRKCMKVVEEPFQLKYWKCEDLKKETIWENLK